MRIVPWLVAVSLSACGSSGSSNRDSSVASPEVGRSDLPIAGDVVADAAGARADAATSVDTGQFADAEPAGACAVVPPAFAALAPQRTLHVASGGNDTSGDGSAGRPFATIERAARDVAPGSAIRVHAGTYAGGIWLQNLRGRLDESPKRGELDPRRHTTATIARRSTGSARSAL